IDRAQNVSEFSDLGFTLDTRAPVVAIGAPSPGLSTNRNLTVTGRVTDTGSGISSLQAGVDGGPLGAVTLDSSGTCRFDTSLPVDGSADGSHMVQLRAQDRAGNASGSSEVAFTLDTQAPAIAIESPNPGLLTDGNITVTGQVTDAGSGIASLQAGVDAGRF